MSSETHTVFTGDYARDFETWSEFYDSSYEIDCLKRHSNLADKRLFEAGCGSGRLSFRLADACRHMVAVDIVPSLVDLCQQRLARRHTNLTETLRFEVQDATSLAYPDGYFDALLDGWTFSVYEDQDAAAAEYERITADGAPFYAIQVREGSDYQRILDEFIPDERLAEWSEGESLEESLISRFGQPEVHEELVTPYHFDSVDEAFQAYLFNFEEWLDIELTEAEQEQLRREIRRYERDGTVRIDEYAHFFKFRLNPST